MQCIHSRNLCMHFSAEILAFSEIYIFKQLSSMNLIVQIITNANTTWILRQVRHQISQEVTQQLVLALIMSRQDYCSVESLWPCHTDANPAVWAASQLQNKVRTALSRPRHPLQSQPGISDGNGSVSRRQQITFRSTLIFYLIERPPLWKKC